MRVLDAVLRRGEPLEAALTTGARHLVGPDRGLAHAIAAETLRRLPDLDALIDSATRVALPDDAKARTALRIALVQVLALGTPPHAAIATVLPLVDGGPRKLVHGVFGTLMREGRGLPEVPTLPAAVAERWTRAWGGEVAAAGARAIAAPPPLDLSLARVEETALWAERLGGVSLMPGHVRVSTDAAVTDLPGFAEGVWWVQDLAASLPARLVPPGAAGVIDACSAPGGKALQLATAGHRVTALDVSATRLERLRDNFARVGASVEVVRADARDWTPDVPADAVLLDAPCSATGIFRRHPDVLHRVRDETVAETAALQRALLARAADWVRPGGTLIYATCSLEPEEGEAQAEAFLTARGDYSLAPVAAGELAPSVAPRDGRVRTLPGMLEREGGLDGFFVARFTRASA